AVPAVRALPTTAAWLQSVRRKCSAPCSPLSKPETIREPPAACPRAVLRYAGRDAEPVSPSRDLAEAPAGRRAAERPRRLPVRERVPVQLPRKSRHLLYVPARNRAFPALELDHRA